MFCKNCGSQMDPNAVVCMNCGFSKGTGCNYCQNCGAQIQPGAAVCVHCGAAINNQYQNGMEFEGQKSKLVAVLLAFFLGAFGVHNFYLGYTRNAILQIVITLVSCGSCSWIWPLIDFIRLLTNSIDRDANGMPLKKEF